jgi:hypothetical protein
LAPFCSQATIWATLSIRSNCNQRQVNNISTITNAYSFVPCSPISEEGGEDERTPPSQATHGKSKKRWNKAFRLLASTHQRNEHSAALVYGDGEQNDTASDRAIRLSELTNPSLLTFRDLKNQLKKNDAEWLLEFLREQQGLNVLLATVDKLTAKKAKQSLQNTLILLECVQCIKNVMSSVTGLDYIIANEDCTQKLAAGRSHTF